MQCVEKYGCFGERVNVTRFSHLPLAVEDELETPPEFGRISENPPAGPRNSPPLIPLGFLKPIREGKAVL
jgi:hypothetical protein